MKMAEIFSNFYASGSASGFSFFYFMFCILFLWVFLLFLLSFRVIVVLHPLALLRGMILLAWERQMEEGRDSNDILLGQWTRSMTKPQSMGFDNINLIGSACWEREKKNTVWHKSDLSDPKLSGGNVKQLFLCRPVMKTDTFCVARYLQWLV